jgi:hypothetical protein
MTLFAIQMSGTLSNVIGHLLTPYLFCPMVMFASPDRIDLCRSASLNALHLGIEEK